MAIDKFQPHKNIRTRKVWGTEMRMKTEILKRFLWRDSWLVHMCHPIRALKKRRIAARWHLPGTKGLKYPRGALRRREPSSRSGRRSSRRRGSPPPGPAANQTPPRGSPSRWSPSAWRRRPRWGCYCCWWGTGWPPPCRRWRQSRRWWRAAGWSSPYRWQTQHLSIDTRHSDAAQQVIGHLQVNYLMSI